MKEELQPSLTEFGQEHLLDFWNRLDQNEQESLAAEIGTIDFNLIDSLYQQRGDQVDLEDLSTRVGEPPLFRLGDSANRFSPEDARNRGIEALRAGEMGIILVAGGRGSRLGFAHPKGTYRIGPVSNNCLFQIIVEKTVAVSRRHGTRLPLYLMTSPATHLETIKFFSRHSRFGLPEDDLRFFCQGTMPAVDAATGKVLLAEPDHVALSPDGHGGMLAAIERCGGLDEFEARGVKHLFCMQVDNPLIDLCSPEFIGYHLLSGSEFSSQVVAKQTPFDKVGNVVRLGEELQVIEYSDPRMEKIAELKKPDGSLLISSGSIAVHVMEVAFLRRMARKADGLPFHVAHKKVKHVDSGGSPVKPEKPNAFVFERFIFDLMPSAKNAMVVEVDPLEHFAPLKNAPGEEKDTPEMVKSRMVALHGEWLRQAGVEVAPGVDVEISPLFALDAEELAEKIEPATRVTEPTYFHES